MSGYYRTPKEFTQGTSVTWGIRVADYDIQSELEIDPDSSTCTCAFAGESYSITITASAGTGSDDYTISLTPAQTAKFNAGQYEFAIRCTDGTKTVEIERGKILVLEDIAADHPLGKQDPRSSARQRYDHYNSMLLQESFVKTLQPGQIEEIENIMRRLEWDIRREEDAEKVKRGMNATRKLYTRFQ